MAILANVGRCLPAQGMDFTDMSSDAGVARLFWNGCGQIYVQKVQEDRARTHACMLHR